MVRKCFKRRAENSHCRMGKGADNNSSLPCQFSVPLEELKIENCQNLEQGGTANRSSHCLATPQILPVIFVWEGEIFFVTYVSSAGQQQGCG